MLNAGHGFPLCRAVAGKLFGDHDTGPPHLPLQQFAQQPLGRLLVASALDQDVEHDTGLVDGSPKPMLYPGNFEHEASGSGHWDLLPTHPTDFGPELEFLGPGSSMLGGSNVIAAKVEEVIDLIVG